MTEIRTGARGQPIRTCSAEELVRPVATQERVVAGPAEQEVCPAAAVEQVVAPSAVERIALTLAERDTSIRAVLIAGMPGVFTAGHDASELRGFLAAAAFGQGPVRLMKTLSTLDKPIVAAVDGLAFGFGTALLFHCDYVVASEWSIFSAPFADIGVPPEGAISILAPRLIGRYGNSVLRTSALVYAIGYAVVWLILARSGAEPSLWRLMPVMLIVAAVQGFIMTPLLNVVLGALPESHVGMAGGSIATMQQVGNALGIAVIGLVLFAAASGGAVGSLHPAEAVTGFGNAVLLEFFAALTVYALLRRLR